MKRIVDVRDEGGCRIDTILIFRQFISPKFKARLNVAEKPQFSQIFFLECFMPHGIFQDGAVGVVLLFLVTLYLLLNTLR